MKMSYIDEDDYECPYCYSKLEEETDSKGKRFKFCENCGESFSTEEEEK